MSHSYNRRQFLQHSSLAGLGLAMHSPLSGLPRFGIFDPLNPVSRSLTPYFIAQDLMRLLQLTEPDQAARQALTINKEHFQLGKAWRIAPEELLKVLKDTRNRWGKEMEQDQAETQLALLAGWTAHHRIAKQLEEGIPTAGLDEPLPEIAVYRDVCVIKMLQNADPHRIDIPVDESIPGLDPAQVEDIFHAMQQRNMIRTHTFKPEFSDIDTWLDRFMRYYDRNREDNAQYAQVYCRPDAAKVRKYLTDPVFYDPEDELIQVSRRIQMAQVSGKTELTGAAPRSQYGKALADALKGVNACTAFAIGKGTEAEIMKYWKG